MSLDLKILATFSLLFLVSFVLGYLIYKPLHDNKFCNLLAYISAACFLGMIGSILLTILISSCSPAPAESIPTSSATFAANIEQLVKPTATPKGSLPTTEAKPLSLDSLQKQVQAIENLQKAQWALALIDTYSNACGRRFDEGDDYTGCVNEAIKCAFKSMENGNVSFDALRRCGEDSNETK